MAGFDRRTFLGAAALATFARSSRAAEEGIVRAIAPTGVLRASINLGNPILAVRDPSFGAVRGVSVDLATALAERLGVACTLVVVDAAGASVERVAADEADVGFFAIDPARGAAIAFTAPYVLIEGAYCVRADSPIAANADVDVPGRRIVVGRGSAYDLYLSRALRHAELVRAPTSPAVVDAMLAGGVDVAAGVRQQLEADARRVPGLRVLDGRFMVIEQAMGAPRSRGDAAATYLARFVEAAKRDGLVADALARHGIDGAMVAPPSQS